ncbi:cupin-like domain-containing protein [Hygrophoropsis aurantiaca]|uniref:Cupin-like domain-containing protein n=1 Tax=Hygrophoropsis aurantiaca TaxID=72124 RepID=A0ACB8AM45_9AGAM|nr:cupin-like domain-containing protein [Hygrophoropsis aurantiaca]
MSQSDEHPVLDQELLQWISREYYEMNGSHIEILDAPPTPIEFSRLIHISRPVVIKGLQIPASARWTNDYLVKKMGEHSISVAFTPNGLADAVTRDSDGKLYFTEPYTSQMTMQEFFDQLMKNPILYLQSQNGNLYSSAFYEQDGRDSSEFQSLRADVPSKHPDAVNLWIGDERSTTSIHSDPYENIYTVVQGSKHFTLLPPADGWCLQERNYPHATYTPSPLDSNLVLTPSSSKTPYVRWSSIADPHLPEALPPEVHPLSITLEAGDTLYLPVGWWHHVRQSGDITVAVNWWYDAEVQGSTWVWLNMLRARDVPLGNTGEDS